MILANAFANGQLQVIGWILLATAGLTAYYTFRVFFRVFVGPVEYHAGEESHGDDHAHGDHAHGPEHVEAEAAVAAHDAHAHGDDHFHPHAPGWAINSVLAFLAIASIAAAFLYPAHWANKLIETSTARLATAGHAAVEHGAEHAAAAGEHAAAAGEHAHATLFGQDPHAIMYYVSGVVGAIGILVAFMLHYAGRKTAATAMADKFIIPGITKAAQHKWYVDEFYNWTLRRPLLVLAHLFYLIDKLIIDGLVDLFGLLPRAAGSGLRPAQSGVMHGYAVGMAGGIAILALVALFLLN
jgi:NADH-quinone oxidoreductase subunit L